MNTKPSFYLLIGLLSGNAAAQVADVSPSWVGTYDVTAKQELVPGRTSMRLVPPAPGQLWPMNKIAETRTVRGKVGVAFGVEYPNDVLISSSWRTVILLPEPGLLDKTTGKYSKRLEYKTPCPSTCQAIYIYEDESEILPGVTKVELWSTSKRVDVQEFVVEK